MKFFSLAIFASLSLTTAVSAWQCLSDADAKQLIDNSVSLLEHPDPEAARKASYADLSPNIVQYSDSINVLYGDPLGKVIYTNSTIFIEDSLSQPGPNVTVLRIIHDCSSVVYFWEFTGVGGPDTPRVKGFSLLVVDDTSQVVEYYVEFNSYQWAENIGFTITPPMDGGEKVKRSLKGTMPMPWRA